MIFIHIDSLETVNHLVKICDKYNQHDIDVVYGRHVVDARSYLGVCSLLGKIVKIMPITDDQLFINFIARELKEIGAWVEDNK